MNVKCGAGAISFVNDVAARELVPGWITLTHKDFGWGTTHETALEISKTIAETVLSVEYFDDDYVEFILYCGGKYVAKHVPEEYECFPRIVGEPKSFVGALSMSPDDEELFRIIFEERDPATAVLLMESLLGCPIEAMECLNNAALPDRVYLKKYLKYIKRQ